MYSDDGNSYNWMYLVRNYCFGPSTAAPRYIDLELIISDRHSMYFYTLLLQCSYLSGSQKDFGESQFNNEH